MSTREQELDCALWELVASIPPGLQCEDFHHAKVDQHRYDQPCHPKQRLDEAIQEATKLLEQQKVTK